MSVQPDSQDHIPEVTNIAKGAGIVFIGSIIGTLFKYLFELIVARSLGAELFGVFFLGFSVFKILERLTTLGLHNGVLRYISIFRGVDDSERIKGVILSGIRIVLSLGTFIAVLLMLFSNIISIKVFNDINLSSVLKIFAIGVIFTGATEIMTFSTQAFRIMKYKVMVRMIFEPGLRIILFIIAFLLGWKLMGAAFAFGLSLLVGSLLAYHYLKRVFPSTTKKEVRPIYETKRILSFSWPLFFVGFFNLFIIHLNTIFLGNFRTSQEVGIYGAAQRTAFVIPIILISFNDIFAPIISDLFHRKDIEKLEILFKIVTKWVFTFGFPVFLLLTFSANEILELWGKEYRAGAICLIIICIAQLINCAVGSVGYMIMMTGRTKINFINNLCTLILMIILNMLLISRYGILGAALSLGIALILINIARLVEVYLILKIHPYSFDFLKPFAAGLVSVFILFILLKNFLQFNNLLLFLGVRSVIFFGIYSVNVYLLGIAKEDKVILEKIKSKLRIW